MHTRTRTRTSYSFHGEFEDLWSGDITEHSLELSDVCHDTVGNPKGENALFLESFTGSPPIVSSVNPGIIGTRIRDMPCNWTGNINYHTASIEPSGPALATQLLAETNPGRVDLSMPVFLAELREFPQLLQLAGNNLLKKGASGNLSFQFGWKPLLSDLQKMLDFNQAVENRMKELERLREKGLVRERVLWTHGDQIVANNVAAYGYYGHGGLLDYTCNRVVKIWGHVKWRPEPSLTTDSAELRKLARRLANGMHSSQLASNLWDAVPWTWLLDWFANIGDFIEATNNHLAYAGTPLIMRHRAYTFTSGNLRPQLGQVEGFSHGSTLHEQKTRELWFAAPTGGLPFLTKRQWSILASLAILKK